MARDGETKGILFLLTLCLQIANVQSQDTRPSSDLSIILLGKGGPGKSLTANSILGREAFKVEAQADSSTKRCEKISREVEGRNIDLIDTQGLFDTRLTSEEVKRELRRCISSVPEPLVFLLVTKLWEFTDDEKKWIQDNLGEYARKHTMLLFIDQDQLVEESLNMSLESFEELWNLFDSFSFQYHSISNKKNNPSQVSELFRKIDKMMEIRQHNTNDDYMKAPRQQESFNNWLKCRTSNSVVPFAVGVAISSVLGSPFAGVVSSVLGSPLGGAITSVLGSRIAGAVLHVPLAFGTYFSYLAGQSCRIETHRFYGCKVGERKVIYCGFGEDNNNV